MSNNNEQFLLCEGAEHMLIQFDDIDELMRGSSDSEKDVITNYFSGDMDLHSVLAQHEADISAVRDDFIQAYVDEAEGICSLYNEFVECEQKLVQFEEEIILFQRRLADSAEDMVKMQQQTVGLVRSINNRRLGSGKLSEVYTALQECDTFCDAITHKAVDQGYLDNIAELAKKLSFLSSNKELEGSAVDLETRPRLHAAAVRAGNKLQRYFSKRIVTLAETEDFASIRKQQALLVETSQKAFSFLKNYNHPIALSIFQEYGKRLSETFSRLVREVLHNFGEICVLHANSFDAIITPNDAQEILCNRDAGSPKGEDQITVVPSTLSFPAQLYTRREQSVSQHMRNFTDRILKLERPVITREATFHDTLAVLGSLKSYNETLTLDATVGNRLENVDCWIWHFVRGMHLIVEICVSECHFIGNFFSFSAAGDEIDETEALVCVVLKKALHIARSVFSDDLPLVTDRQSVLAGLRIIDIVKAYLCHLHDPLPLLLLSGIIEMTKTTLTSTLHSVMANDQELTQFLLTLRVLPFQHAQDSSQVSLSKLLEDHSYAATLGPHPIVQKFAQILGELELLNSVCLYGSTVNGREVMVYDSAISNVLYRELEIVLEFIKTLAKRHKNLLAQCFFSLNNIFYILAVWRRMTSFLPYFVGTDQSPCAAPPAHVACIESHLSNELARFVEEDSKASGTFGYLFKFVQEAEAALGITFFESDGSAVPPLGSLPAALSEEGTMQAVSDFNQTWASQLLEIRNSIKRAVASTTTLVTVAATQDKFAVECVKELEDLIFKEYTQGLVEANTKLHLVATRLFGKNSDMHAKLTSNTTVLHEVRKIL